MQKFTELQKSYEFVYVNLAPDRKIPIEGHVAELKAIHLSHLTRKIEEQKRSKLFGRCKVQSETFRAGKSHFHYLFSTGANIVSSLT